MTRRLEECGGTTRPALAFFLGDAFDVFYIGTCLGEDVVEIVANADEGETFVEEFADAGGAE